MWVRIRKMSCDAKAGMKGNSTSERGERGRRG